MKSIYTRTIFAPILVCLAMAEQAVADAPANQNGAAQRSQLSRFERMQLYRWSYRSTDERYAGKQLQVLVVSRRGEAEEARQALRRQGYDIAVDSGESGVFAVVIPVERLGLLDGLNSIEHWEVSSVGTREPSTFRVITPRMPEKNTYTTSQPCITFSQLYGLEQFLAKHPTYDGRGVGIGQSDGSPDITHPQFQVATTLQGNSRRKLADIVMASARDFRDDMDLERPNYVGSWIAYAATVDVEDSQFDYQGKTYRAPKPGRFRIGFLKERRVMGYINPRATATTTSMAVLTGQAEPVTWVDMELNGDFRNSKPLRSYEIAGEYHQEPSTPDRPTLPFAIKSDREGKGIWLVNMNTGHATATGSLMAGNPAPATAPLISMAPGAALFPILSNQGLTSVGSNLAAQLDGVDVIIEFSGSTGSVDTSTPVRLDQGAYALAGERMVEHYRKPLVSVGADGMAAGDGVVSSEGRREVASIFGVRLANEITFFPPAQRMSQQGRLPLAAGHLNGIALNPWPSVNRYYCKLPGLDYGNGGGACGTNVGLVGVYALLISGAKQEGLKYDPHRLRAAVATGARWMPNADVVAQGNGLLNLEGAWDALKRMPAGELDEIVSSGPLVNQYSRSAKEPDKGPGLYEEIGWQVGKPSKRVVTLTRIKGPSGNRRLTLKWKGNEKGVFKAASSVDLPLNVPVEVPIEVRPAGFGLNAALLILQDDKDITVHQVSCGVLVAEQPFARDTGWTVKGSLGTGEILTRVFTVPEGFESGELSLDIDPNIGVRVSVAYGAPAWDTPPPNRDQEVVGRTRSSLKLNELKPGPYYLTIYNSRGGTLAAYSGRLQPEASPGAAGMENYRVRLEKKLAMNAAAQAPSSLLEARLNFPAHSSYHTRELQVPPGLRRLEVLLEYSGTDANMGVVLLSPSGTTPSERYAVSSRDQSKVRLWVDNPQPGRYRVVGDADRLPHPLEAQLTVSGN